MLAIGLSERDADLVEHLVREHLALALLATKRDHADPRTQQALVEAVQGRADVLALLRYLTEADARAAGPAAWSPWRAQLINGLADQVEGAAGRRRHRGPRWRRPWWTWAWPARSGWTGSRGSAPSPSPAGCRW